MKPMRKWDKISEKTKKEVLCAIGVKDPREVKVEETCQDLMTMWGEYMKIGFDGGEGKFAFVSPYFIEALVFGRDLDEALKEGEACLELSYTELHREMKRQEVRESVLRGWWEKSEVLLSMLIDKDSNSMALMAVRKDSPVRMYETAGKRSEVGFELPWG